MSKSHRKTTKIQYAGFVFAFLYLLQITVLPVIHSHFHVAEDNNSSSDQSDHQKHVLNCEHEHDGDSLFAQECRGDTESDHSSHDASTCTLCLGMHKGGVFVITDISILARLFPAIVEVSEHDAYFPTYLHSSNPPRAPPAPLS